MHPTRYEVLEGNRRILALRALETLSLVSPALTPALNRRLTDLAGKYEAIRLVRFRAFSSSRRMKRFTGCIYVTRARTRVSGLVEWDRLSRTASKSVMAASEAPRAN